MTDLELLRESLKALEMSCAEMCEGCRYDAQLVADNSGHHKPRIGGYGICRAREQRSTITKLEERLLKE